MVKIKLKTSKKAPTKTSAPTIQVDPLTLEKVNLPAAVFGLNKIYEQAIFDTIMMERASRRQGTHSVKTRGEVSGSGIKPWRQKGTGKARAGSLRSPHFVGGGRAFGPQAERNYQIKVNKKVRRLAFFSALTLAAQEKQVFVISPLQMEQPKTKALVLKLNTLSQLENKKNIVIVSSDANVFKSSRNLAHVKTVKLNSLTVETIIGAEALLFSAADLKTLEGMVK